MFSGFEIVIGVFIGVLLAVIVVLVMHMRTTAQVSKMTFPAYEYAMKKAEHDAQGLLAEAQKQARHIVSEAQEQSSSIIADAEKTGHETITQYTDLAAEIHKKYKEVIAKQTQDIDTSLDDASHTHLQSLEKMLKSTEDALTTEQKRVTELVERTSAGLESFASNAEHQAQEIASLVQDKITTVSQAIESHLLKAEAKGEEALTTHIEALQKTADSHITAYEDSRMQLLDTHIEQLVESVVVKVLHTQLPVSEHASLARTALEEAKATHIL